MVPQALKTLRSWGRDEAAHVGSSEGSARAIGKCQDQAEAACGVTVCVLKLAPHPLCVCTPRVVWELSVASHTLRSVLT